MIRPLEGSDPAAITDAFAAIGWDKPAEQYEQYFAEQEVGRRDVFVATVDKEFAGYVTLNWHPEHPPFRTHAIPEIQDLNVLPVYRRRGIGSALIAAAETAAQARADAVGICVGLTSDYGAAQRLYTRKGYMPDGRGVASRNQPVVYGEHVRVDDDLVLRMTKRLSDG